MPLDTDARRYADNLFAQAQDEIETEFVKKSNALYQDFTFRKMIRSGGYISAVTNNFIEKLERLCEAKIQTLLIAYEKAGLPFDKDAHLDISNEISQYRIQTEMVFVGRIRSITASTFQGSQPAGFDDAVLAEFARGADRTRVVIDRKLQIKRDEIVLDEKRAKKTYAAGLGKKWDAFISHASEDKDEFVRPLAQALAKSGLAVWYDEFTLTVGDSLRRKIDEGIASSRFGIVVLSPSFFAKRWPQEELDGLYSREVAGVKVILPVWHNVTLDVVRQYSPLLAGKLAASGGIASVVVQLRQAMGL